MAWSVVFAALYGLKQAPRALFERFASVVTVVGFSPSAHDHALFVTVLLVVAHFFYMLMT